jgi:predicted DNA-binding protein
VAKKNRIFRMDDETYAKLTALSAYFGMKRAALLRLFIEEKYHQTRRLGKL